jgi:peptide/nickel transport system substrate-binding protein
VTGTVEFTRNEASTIEPGGTLRVGLHSFGIIERKAGDLVFSRLIRWDEDMNFIGDTALDWDVSDDGLNYTFYLRDDIQWQDGAEFNASDVQFTYEAVMKGPSQNGTWPSWPCVQEAIDQIESVTVLNRTTIRFHLHEAFGPFLYHGATNWLIPRHLYEDTGALYAYDFRNNPDIVGCGPFKFNDIAVEANFSLVVNPSYYRGRPYLDGVVFTLLPNEQAPEELQNNRIDLIPNWILPERISEIESIPGLTVASGATIGFNSLDFNLRKPIINDTDVRRAISHAINRTWITEDYYRGYAKDTYSTLPPSMSL